MDCSNPVLDATRVRLDALYGRNIATKRQDLAYLKSLAETAERHLLPGALPRAVPEEVVKAEWSALKESAPPSPPGGKEDLDLSFLKEVREATPICNRIVDGRPLHPPAKANKKGRVSVTRTFGGSQTDWELVRRMLHYIPKDEVEEALATSVYTRGTAKGFVNRLKEQVSRKCIPISRAHGGMPATLRRLKALLPFEAEKLVDWTQDLGDLVGAITTSSAASAGAPYWRPKGEVLYEMQNFVLPILHEHLSEGRLAELRACEPELFLAECKNKMDRYDPAKLEDKTRPYFSFPFHWSALFSVLSQSFSRALKLFYEDGANAYGFSWAHGGTGKLVDWAKQTGELGKEGGRPRFCAYGDDCDLYYRRNGVLYRVAPDFRQMDGSVDRECVEITVRYVLEAHAHRFGREAYAFWEAVGEEWVRMATDPEFLVDGERTYRKPQQDGLATGVVGTTLFDTVKAILSYDAFVTQVHDFKRYELLEEASAVKFFRTMGLEIKTGTWDPQPVWETPEPGRLFTPHKFLGMQIRWEAPFGEVSPVPALPSEDWWHLLLVPREMEEAGAKRSRTAYNRTLFDRLRGLLTTGAQFDERAMHVFNTLLNEVPAEVVLMTVQAGNGKGEGPSYALFDPDGTFEYPISEGVPTMEWTWGLYTGVEAEFQRVFPGLREKLSEYRTTWRRSLPTVSGVKRNAKAAVVVSAPLQQVETMAQECLPLSGKKSDTYAAVAVKKKSPVIEMTLHNGRIEEKQVPRAPGLVEALQRYITRPMSEEETAALSFAASAEVARAVLGEITSEDVEYLCEAETRRLVPVHDCCQYLGASEVQVRKAAVELGYLVVGPWDSKWITPTPIWLPPAQAADQEKQIEAFEKKVADLGLKAKGYQLKQKNALQEEKHAPAYLPGGILTVGPSPPRCPTALPPDGSGWKGALEAFAKVGIQLTYAARNRRTELGQEVEMAVMWRDQRVVPQEARPWFEVFGPSSQACREAASECMLEMILAEVDKLPLDGSRPGAWFEASEVTARLEVRRGYHPILRLVKNEFVPGPALAETEWRVEGGRIVGPGKDKPTVLAMRDNKTVAQMAESLRRTLGPEYLVCELHPKTPQPKTQPEKTKPENDEWKEPEKKLQAQSEQQPSAAESGGCGSSEPKKRRKPPPTGSSASLPVTGNGSSVQRASPRESVAGGHTGPHPPSSPSLRRNPSSARRRPVGPLAPKELEPANHGRGKPHDQRSSGGGMEPRTHVAAQRRRNQSDMRAPRSPHVSSERIDRLEDSLRDLAKMVSKLVPRSG